jgi:phosphoribosylpyrophosphate synthetase
VIAKFLNVLKVKFNSILLNSNLNSNLKIIETRVDIGESVRGKDVFIIQTGSK